MGNINKTQFDTGLLQLLLCHSVTKFFLCEEAWVAKAMLSSVVHSSTESADEEGAESSRQFDFLIKGELIRNTLGTHISERNIPTVRGLNFQ